MPDGVALSDVLDRGADAFRDVDVVVVFVPTWRSNGDAPLGRAIGMLAATGTHVAAIAVEVGSDDARRVAALRAEEIDGFITTLDEAGADTYPWRHGSNLADALTVARAVVG
jgi:hypothetical protein